MRIFLFLLSLIFTSSAFAADGILSYKKADGTVATAAVVSPVCSTTDGTPVTCVNGLSAEAGSSGLINYKNASGMMMSAIPVVPVCSVSSAGVPQICDMSASTDLSAYLTTTAASTTYIPLSQVNQASGVAGLNSSSQVTAAIYSNNPAQTGPLQVNGQINAQGIGYFVSSMAQIQGIISGTAKKWTLSRRTQDTYTKLNSYNGSTWQAFSFNDDGTLDSSVGQFANLGADAPFIGTVSAPTISAKNSATVPDTTTTDSTTAALNTESAAARFVSKTDAASFLTSSALTPYLTTALAQTTYAPLASPAFTGTPTSTTPATTDSSTKIATTAYVNNAFQAVEYSVQGDISTSGSSIQIPFGTSGLYAKFAYTGSGSASMTFCSSSGTLSPVDIRRNSIWGSSGVETYTLDNGSVGTSCVTADSTVYTNSQDSSAYFIRVGGTVYFLTVWASNAGARAFMGVHKMI